MDCVRLEDDFWAPRMERNRSVTLPTQYRRCEETGRIDNFRRAAGKRPDLPFQGRYYNDSDVYKWAEACAYALAQRSEPELADSLEALAREIAAAQQPDGYLNTYFSCERQDERWTNLRDLHELYCAGHLIQAAIAYAPAGETPLLRAARRYADHICDVFGPNGREGACGHQEIEMALVELYRLTRDEKYLTQARLFIERRGRKPPLIGGSSYHQDHAPFRSLEAVTGHAVRMMYYCCGAADVYAETGDPEYLAALERLWESMVVRRMYVTGGVGSRYEGEAFGEDYELPNDRAYAETCAAIGVVMWNWRMLQITGEARFADVMENALYNGMLPGLSLDGETYFYQDPLADTGRHRRTPWFECSCCPPNIARMLASLPAYFCSASDEGVWVHLFAAGHAEVPVPGGCAFAFRQETRYPWDGQVLITVETDTPLPVALRIRVPHWVNAPELLVNDQPVAAAPGQYALVCPRLWRAGDVVRLSLPMPVTRVHSHPYVANNTGRAALRRGPLVYCIEQADLAGVDPRDVVLPPESNIEARWEPDLLGGVVSLTGPALVRAHQAAWNGALYEQDEEIARPEERPITLMAVPYYAWGNREPGGMAVWIREER
jgi:DUF1680 family protein